MPILKRLLFIVGALCIFGFSFAEKGIWGLDDIDIISRKERGADESLRYKERQEYQNHLKAIEERKKYIELLKDTNFEEYLKIKTSEYISSYRYEYLQETYQDERSIDKTIKEENGKELWWSYRYHYKKDRIILHHTDDNNDQLKTKEDVIKKINAIYRYHTLTKLWGDIGYNFLIDRFGNIYEGRAGGEGVIGAHSMYNNRASIGIALIGNFQDAQPTGEMMDSLEKLLVALSSKYNINPYDKVKYHISSSVEPYITDNTYYAIAGHTDSGKTACPGKYIIQKFDSIRSKVYKKVFNKELPLSSPTNGDVDIYNKAKIIKKSKIYFIPKDTYSIKVKEIGLDGVEECSAMDDSFQVLSCDLDDDVIKISLKYNKALASGSKKIWIKSSKNNYILKIKLIWQSDLDFVLNKQKDLYKERSGFKDSSESVQKLSYKIDINEALRLTYKRVNVLLYNVTLNYDSWDLECDDMCDAKLDSFEFNGIKKIKVVDKGSALQVNIDGNIHTAKELKIINKGIVEFTNVSRKSYAGIGWNIYKGDIYITKDNFKEIGKNLVSKYVVINQVDFQDYLAGIAEVNDQVSLEKAKAMALLVKTYALFYLNGKNRHPSIPEGVSYNAVDDARIFQKYVGEGYRNTSKVRRQALESTKLKVLIYDDYIPILPYFNCSAGFVFSAKEKFGRIDTPYLTSKLDFDSCENFNGHGVGLSGKGAEELAQKGANYDTILKYYYDGIKIKRFY